MHDIQYKLLPGYHSARRRAWLDFYLPWMFERADSIILISQSEKKHVEEFFGPKCSAKCDVVYNAIDWGRFESSTDETSNPQLSQLLSHPYILSVCHQFPHKNLETLLLAFEQISRRHPDTFLYMVGVDSASNRQFVATRLSSAVRDRVKILGFLADQELGSLYRGARLFALPSLYEGFGMPAVEALGLGAPVLMSGTTALPEVTLGLGNYVENPMDIEAWIHQIDIHLHANGRPAAEVVDKIRKAYSPPSIAQSLIAALKERERHIPG